VRHTYTSRRERRIDFWVAFAGWFVINSAVIFLISQMSGNTAPPIVAGLLLLANIGAPIVMAFTRAYLALGILVAFASALAVTVIEGVFSTIGDFVAAATGYQGSNIPTPVIVALMIGGLVALVGVGFVLRAIHLGIR
jgi:hypothetical protein